MKLIYSLAAMFLLLSLNACTPTVVRFEPVEANKWQQQQQVLKQIQAWLIKGKISVSTEDDGGQAEYSWQQFNQTDYNIRLQAPMGMGTAVIKGNVGGVHLQTSDGSELYGTDVDKLIYKLNGWPLPVSGLQYWVRGLPVPDVQYDVSEWNENDLPQVMLQNGWRIEFRKYKSNNGVMLPAKLFISRDDNKEVDVRLIIRQWQLNTTLDVVRKKSTKENSDRENSDRENSNRENNV
jgi:outer membrane lipoprotein LolB